MNLIVTCPRHFEPDAADELERLCEMLGFGVPRTTITEMPGILTAEAGGDPVGITRAIVALIRDEPWSVRYAQRIIPVQETTVTRMEEILGSAGRLRSGMGAGDTFRVTVEKRHSDISGREIISGIADIIRNRVSLEDPDWVVLVEVLGARTGVSVIRPGDVASVQRVKRSLSEQD